MAYSKPRTTSLTDYLKIEQEEQERYEYHGGYLYQMSGGSIRHATITANVISIIIEQLKVQKSGCRTYTSDLKIELKAGVRYVYANGSVFCEPVEESEQLPGAAKNPILIIEILSKTTASYDRGKKGAWYRMMPSLRDYVMITQSRPSISHYSRKDRLTLYTYRDLIGLDATLELESIGVTIPLTDIHEDITSDPEAPHKPQRLHEPFTPYGQAAE